MKYKLKDNVTEEQLRECGFERTKFSNDLVINKQDNCFLPPYDWSGIVIRKYEKELKPFNKDGRLGLNDWNKEILQDLIKKGYVEVVE